MTDLELWVDGAIRSALGPLENERVPLDLRTGQAKERWLAELGHRLCRGLVGRGDLDVRTNAGPTDIRLGVSALVPFPGEVILLRVWFDASARTLRLERVDASDPIAWLDRADEREAEELRERATYERLREKFEP